MYPQLSLRWNVFFPSGIDGEQRSAAVWGHLLNSKLLSPETQCSLFPLRVNQDMALESNAASQRKLLQMVAHNATYEYTGTCCDYVQCNSHLQELECSNRMFRLAVLYYLIFVEVSELKTVEWNCLVQSWIRFVSSLL